MQASRQAGGQIYTPHSTTTHGTTQPRHPGHQDSPKGSLRRARTFLIHQKLAELTPRVVLKNTKIWLALSALKKLKNVMLTYLYSSPIIFENKF